MTRNEIKNVSNFLKSKNIPQSRIQVLDVTYTGVNDFEIVLHVYTPESKVDLANKPHTIVCKDGKVFA